MKRKTYVTSWIIFTLILHFSCSNKPGTSSVDSSNKKNSIVDSVKKDTVQKFPMLLITPPRVEKKDGSCTLILAEEIKKILHDYDSTFQLWKASDYVKSVMGDYNYYTCSENQLQYAVIGKFNEDSIADVVVSGHNKKHSLILGIVSSGQTFRVIEIEKQPVILPKDTWFDNEDNKGLWEFLVYYDPGKSESEKYKISPEQDAFLTVIYGKASTIYWMDGDKFKSASHSD